MDLTSMLRPDRIAQPPRNEAIEREDREREREIDDRRRLTRPEPFDAHLGRVLPPGWGALTEEEWQEGVLAGRATPDLDVTVPVWMLPAVEAPVESGASSALSLRVVPVQIPETRIHADEVVDSLRKGAPIPEAHFPLAVLVQAQQTVQRGEPLSRLSVQIAPEHLGSVNMTVELQGQGVSVQLQAQSQSAVDALEGRAEEIRAILVAHGFKAQGLRIEMASPRGQHGGSGQGEGSPGGHRFPNRWLVRRSGDLDEAIDVAVG
ncbi:MAG: flagellar hook-length control protein FliK [bacterium]|nr:flagellar hook-length control protein FliK [bacterium]